MICESEAAAIACVKNNSKVFIGADYNQNWTDIEDENQNIAELVGRFFDAKNVFVECNLFNRIWMFRPAKSWRKNNPTTSTKNSDSEAYSDIIK